MMPRITLRKLPLTKYSESLLWSLLTSLTINVVRPKSVNTINKETKLITKLMTPNCSGPNCLAIRIEITKRLHLLTHSAMSNQNVFFTIVCLVLVLCRRYDLILYNNHIKRFLNG